MRIYNRYVVTLTIAACLVNIVLAFLGQNDLAVYFIVNFIVYLAVTLLYVHFSPRVRRALDTISIVLVAGFTVTVAIKALEILSG